MTSFPIRDQINDHLLTPKNAAMIFIDYQPTQRYATSSMDLQLLVDNVVRVAKLGKIFNLPIVLSTVNVKGGQKPTIPSLKQVLSDQPELDRTTINAWEDKEFLQAVEATGRKKLIMCALWTEACLIFPSLDALRDGYEVYPVVDAVGGTSLEAHQYALQRIALAGGKFESWTQLMCELLETGLGQKQSKQYDRLPLTHLRRSPRTYSDLSTSREYPLLRNFMR